MKITSVRSLLFAVLVCAAAALHAADPSFAPAIEAARADVRALAAATRTPGLSIAVAVDGRVVWAEGVGLADLEQQVPASAGTRYRLGSVSKLFTASMAARLAERGALELDAPIQKLVMTFPVKASPVTARQLAGHLAGIRHYQDSDPIFAGKRYATLEAGLEIFSGDRLVSTPGERYHYTSYGYNLLGVAVERASGKSFGAALADEVVRPLGLSSVGLDDPSAIVPDRSAFYELGPDGAVRNARPNDSSYKWPSGGLLGSAPDLVRFASAHLQRGYLGEVMLAQMFTPQKLADGTATNVGLGWRINEKNGVKFYHHGGTIPGGRAFLLALPNERIAVAVLTNMLVRFGEDEVLAIAQHFVRSAPGGSLAQ